MKILKHGKVEQRKFVCPDCGCIFVASNADFEHDSYGKWAICPQEGCERNFIVRPDDGEPYEEPTPTPTPTLTLTGSEMLARALFATTATDDRNSMADKERLVELFNEGKDMTNFIDFLIANGVTFREG